MRIPVATDFKSRTGNPDKDARLRNCYIESKGPKNDPNNPPQTAIRKRPIAQGGVAVGTGQAQGGIGLNINGVPSFIGFWGDALIKYTGGGTNWNAGTAYNVGDMTSVNFVDYWAISSNTNSQPPNSNWSPTYVPSIPAPPVTYATWNPADKVTVTLSNGNLTAFTAHGGVRSTIGKSSGKWYWEYTITANNSYDGTTIQTFGVATLTSFLGNEVGNDAGGWGYGNDNGTSLGIKRNNSINVAYGSQLPISIPANFNIGIALDMTAGTLSFYLNGISQGVAYSGLTGTLYAEIGMQTQINGQNITVTANFGASAFAYSVPSGFNSGLHT